MNRLIKTAAAFILGASLLMPSAGAFTAYAETEESSSQTEEAQGPAQLAVHPIVLNYSLTNSKGKAMTTVRRSDEFNLTLRIKDIGVKTNQINGAQSIDFSKILDSFSGELKSVTVTSSGSSTLTYDVVLEKVKWTGRDSSFNFMVGYPDCGGEYAQCSVSIIECEDQSGGSGTPDYSISEPIFKIVAADEPTLPIKAGDKGEFSVRITNLGSIEATSVLVEITPSDDTLIIDGTGSQDISYIGSGDRKTVTVKYKALDKINSEKQNFNVTLRYYYENGVTEMSGSTSATVSLAAEISTTERVYPVILSELDIAETVLKPNTEYTGIVTVNNIGTADMKGVFVKFSGTDSFIITGGTGSRYFAEIPMGAKQQIAVKFKTLGQIEGLRQDLSMSMTYNYIMGSDELNGTYEESFTMFSEPSGREPVPVVTGSVFDEPIEAGKRYRYTLSIENIGDCAMDNVQVNISGSEGINVVNGTGMQFVDSIGVGKTKKLSVLFETSAEISAVKQNINAEITYFYTNAGKRSQGSKSATLVLDADVSAAPVIRMSGERLTGAILPNTEYEYTITLTNHGGITVRDIFTDFAASDSLYFLDGTEFAFVDIIRPGQSADIKVKFRTTEQITSFKQGITAAIKYSYGRSSSILQSETSGSVTIIAAGPVSEGGSSSDAAPNVIIGGYNIGADQIPAGEVFNLDLDFYNTNSKTAIENLIMTVNASGSLGIYGGGNTYFYPSMPAAGQISESVALRAFPTAETGTASVNISFKYDYISGGVRNTVTSEQTLFIPIFQPDKMTFSVTQPTYDVYAGYEVYITLSYLNKGRADVSNLKAEIVGDIGALSTEKIIGNVAAGGNGTADFIVTPYMPGDNSFVIKLTYEDSTMTEITQEVPVNLSVMDMPIWNDPGMWDEPFTMEAEGEGEFPWFILWIGIGVLVVGGVVAIILIVRHKKKKRAKLTEADINWEDDLDDILSDKDSKTKV